MRRVPLIFALLLLAGCTDSPVSNDSADVANSYAEDVIGPLGKTSKVQVCHYPPSDPDNLQVISVGENAADNHVRNHAGDGIVGVHYDENCEPLSCPCFTAQDLDDTFPSGSIWDNGPRFQDTPGGTSIAASNFVVNRYVAAVITTGIDSRGALYCLFEDQRNGTLLIRKPIAIGEHSACNELIRAKQAVEQYPGY